MKNGKSKSGKMPKMGPMHMAEKMGKGAGKASKGSSKGSGKNYKGGKK